MDGVSTSEEYGEIVLNVRLGIILSQGRCIVAGLGTVETRSLTVLVSEPMIANKYSNWNIKSRSMIGRLLDGHTQIISTF